MSSIRPPLYNTTNTDRNIVNTSKPNTPENYQSILDKLISFLYALINKIRAFFKKGAPHDTDLAEESEVPQAEEQQKTPSTPNSNEAIIAPNNSSDTSALIQKIYSRNHGKIKPAQVQSAINHTIAIFLQQRQLIPKESTFHFLINIAPSDMETFDKSLRDLDPQQLCNDTTIPDSIRHGIYKSRSIIITLRDLQRHHLAINRIEREQQTLKNQLNKISKHVSSTIQDPKLLRSMPPKTLLRLLNTSKQKISLAYKMQQNQLTIENLRTDCLIAQRKLAALEHAEASSRDKTLLILAKDPLYIEAQASSKRHDLKNLQEDAEYYDTLSNLILAKLDPDMPQEEKTSTLYNTLLYYIPTMETTSLSEDNYMLLCSDFEKMCKKLKRTLMEEWNLSHAMPEKDIASWQLEFIDKPQLRNMYIPFWNKSDADQLLTLKHQTNRPNKKIMFDIDT